MLPAHILMGAQSTHALHDCFVNHQKKKNCCQKLIKIKFQAYYRRGGGQGRSRGDCTCRLKRRNVYPPFLAMPNNIFLMNTFFKFLNKNFFPLVYPQRGILNQIALLEAPVPWQQHTLGWLNFHYDLYYMQQTWTRVCKNVTRVRFVTRRKAAFLLHTTKYSQLSPRSRCPCPPPQCPCMNNYESLENYISMLWTPFRLDLGRLKTGRWKTEGQTT